MNRGCSYIEEDMAQSAWRAVYCKAREERRAEAHLENQGFEVFLPRVRTRWRRHGHSSVRVEPMFPRYLFVSLAAFEDDWSTIRSTRGVSGLVRFGDQFPVVPNDFVAALRDKHATAGAVDITGVQEMKPDDPVEITDGALAGMRAVFRASSGKERVIVLMSLLNREKEIEVPRDCVRKIV